MRLRHPATKARPWGTAFPMRRAGQPFGPLRDTALIVFVLVLGGCQMFPVQPTGELASELEAASPSPSAPEATPAAEETTAAKPDSLPGVSAALIDDLRRELNHQAWIPDPRSSVLTGTDNRATVYRPASTWTWKLSPRVSTEDSARATPTLVGGETPKDPLIDHPRRWLYEGSRGLPASASGLDRSATLAALELIAKDETAAGWNARILLARWQPDRALPHRSALEELTRGDVATLEDAEGKKGTMSPTRAAASEAWCVLLATAGGLTPGGEPVSAPNAPIADEVLSDAGWMLSEVALPREVRATLWKSLARWIPPAELPQLESVWSAALSEGSLDLEAVQSALEVCLVYARRSADGWRAEAWPAAIWHCRLVNDSRSRLYFGRWSAMVGHDRAIEVLRSQLNDSDADVRQGAITSLGLIATDEAKAELQKLTRDSAENTRRLAVAALANWSWNDLEPFAADPSGRIRRAVAEGLSHFPERSALSCVGRLLSDRDVQVQSAMLDSLTKWPDELALPALVKGLDTSSLPTRRQIVTRLQERTSEPILFPVDGDGPARQSAARELANRWNIEPWWKSGELTASGNGLTAEAVLDDVTRTLGEAVAEGRPLTSDERERLTSHGTGGIAALETAARQSPQFRELAEPLLRAASEPYALLDKFADKEVTVRRSAAHKLVALGEQQSLSRDFLVALRQRLLHEQDRQVWFAILQLLRNEPGDEAAAVAMLAVHQPWPDLRSLGADYVGRHPQPERAMWLLPLLGDPDPAVQEAAARALGACQNPRALDGLPASETGEPALPGLRSLLTSSHANVEWTAIMAMASLGDEQATSELLRRALDPHPRVRERVIRAMGETGNRRLVDSLIEMGWTERDPQVLQAILWSLDRLVPLDQRDAELIRAGGLAASAPIEDKIRMWADWQARRKSAAR